MRSCPTSSRSRSSSSRQREARRWEISDPAMLRQEDLAEPLEGPGEGDSPDAGEQAHTREPAPQG
ncbi:hypothetical protein BCONGLO52_14150 [Brachybacterium conglomeratum]|uniref:Uncharacterized protein n=1 Tax=Brachybacterium conglomeratum TaxID=47846 RepID=A0ABQ5RFF5_9MICO|nr:hypothetical protein BCONGLO52_14150 [Brachybacterium conglomeratum]GLK05088.1 hypothetical protein GCM10017597_18880 [Brachybacterium conglomeratum]